MGTASCRNVWMIGVSGPGWCGMIQCSVMT
jgi:hypothetical protein